MTAEKKHVEQPKAKKSHTGDCPWCNYDNQDEKVGELHSAEENIVSVTPNGQFQCHTCGKHWDKDALGKQWTLALERGAAWEREHKARQLTGR